MKCLIAVNPNGAACFVSDLFEGSISDVDIFEQCGILQHVNLKDSFLVDKEFTVLLYCCQSRKQFSSHHF